MASFIKILFYVLLAIVLYILCLYQFPQLGNIVDTKSNTHINEDIKYKVDDLLDIFLGRVDTFEAIIDNPTPNSTRRLEERFQDIKSAN